MLGWPRVQLLSLPWPSFCWGWGDRVGIGTPRSSALASETVWPPGDRVLKDPWNWCPSQRGPQRLTHCFISSGKLKHTGEGSFQGDTSSTPAPEWNTGLLTPGQALTHPQLMLRGIRDPPQLCPAAALCRFYPLPRLLAWWPPHCPSAPAARPCLWSTWGVSRCA